MKTRGGEDGGVGPGTEQIKGVQRRWHDNALKGFLVGLIRA